MGMRGGRIGRAVGRAVVLVVAAATACLAFAQPARPTDPVPPIPFAAWREEFRDETTIEYSASFPSAFVTEQAVNNVVPLRIFVPARAEGRVPAVLVLHYWGANDLRVERSLAIRLNEQGLAAVVMTLPYHLQRTPAGFRSGELAIQPDPARLIATMTQSVLDVRRAIDFIQSRPEFNPDQLGITGISLGSIVSSLAYAIDPRLQRAAFLFGGIDLAKMVWSSSRLVPARDVLRREGYTEARLRESLEVVEPGNYLAQRAVGPGLVIGGRFDTVVPTVSTEKLIAALPDARVLWIDTGHYGGVVIQRKLLRTVATFFATEFSGERFVAPNRLYAPTVRLGVLGSTADGLEVGVGLDALRGRSPRDPFISVFVTPRGPKGLIGIPIDRGFSIGAVGGPKRVGIGLFWSTVL